MAEEYLPEGYVAFRDSFPDVTAALDGLGKAADGAGPLDQRTMRLVKLGIAIGCSSEGAVRSNARKALAVGVTADELRHAAILAFTTCGFPAGIAGLGWIAEVLDAET
ncbi:MAG TPA: carboxymuconolactone decarboxylase family protein [Thermoleophilia bacterium]|nr:carboxymuconolactone decarboxylase family protein [Thermoleophilia bacterium]